jgi:predicted alpha-1,2-mannosidase
MFANHYFTSWKLIAVTLTLLLSLNAQAQQQQPYHTYVDPMIGSQGLGHIFVGPSTPFGMVKPGPDCGVGNSNSGYQPAMSEPVIGFSQVHVSGTGGGPKYGNIQLMPFVGETDEADQRSLRNKEVAKLGYYGVTLKKHNIKAELTTTAKAAFHQYIYPSKSNKSVKLDAGFFLGEKPVPDAREAQQFVGSEIEVVSPTEVRGYSRIRGGWNNGAAYTVYFYAVLSQPMQHFTTWKGSQMLPGQNIQTDNGDKTGALMYLGNAGSDTVKIKIGISFISTSKAKQNVDTEIPHWTFNRVLEENKKSWEALFKKLEIDAAATTAQKTMFYTALYHTMLMPVDRTGENPLWTSYQPYYDDFYTIWDTFRSSSPLLTLVTPSRQVQIINSLLNIYQHDGYMPDARSGNYNGRTQGGSHAEVVIADAFVKGLTGINYEQALTAMLKDATVPPGGNEEKEGRGGLPDYNTLGYVSSNYVRAGNRTVDYAYDDYCIATVAKGLNYTDVYKRYKKQAGNWQNLWRANYTDHGAKGFIMPKDAAGKWIDSIAYAAAEGKIAYLKYTPITNEYPKICWWCCFFYEGTSWEYSLSIPHDVPEVIKKSGGNAAFINRLDTLFARNYYDVANEPSFLTPCLYHWAGRPDLSGLRIKQIVNKNFNTSAAGIPGNDDSGAMSSWLIFHMMGFYPNAGQSYYLLHAPLLKRSVLHQENGNDFKITALNLSDKNQYISSATLNGKPFNQAWIEHKDIVKGGELVLQMDSKPSKWGTQGIPPAN